jgi:transposase-like protein
MDEKTLAPTLKGTVEVDETYVGGKPREGGREGNFDHRRKAHTGRGTKKIPVMVLVERNGNAVSKPIVRVDAKHLHSVIRKNVSRESTIMTDEWKGYNGIGKFYFGGHRSVKHSMGEYVNGDITTNTAESYFALLKRGVAGTFHHISKSHISRYCDEFSFRWNHRKMNDGTRAEHAIAGAEGKRLTYKKAVC